jgi:hypothetical protein
MIEQVSFRNLSRVALGTLRSELVPRFTLAVEALSVFYKERA